jgi:GNAT superfamily N-acetyltransferase
VSQPSFREITTADIEEVAALVVRCDELTADWAPPGFQLPDGHAEREIEVWREDFASERFRAEVACNADRTIVGVVASLGSTDDAGAGSGHVTSLFVDPELHGRRIGARLLARAEEWLRADGCDQATLNVLEGAPAMAFYEATGWVRDGRRKLYEPFDLPTIGYSKAL